MDVLLRHLSENQDVSSALGAEHVLGMLRAENWEQNHGCASDLWLISLAGLAELLCVPGEWLWDTGSAGTSVFLAVCS